MEVDARNELGPCALGFLDNLCCPLKLSKLKQDLPAERLLSIHYKLSFDQEAQICSHREARYLTKYKFCQKICCNPLHKPIHYVTKNLRIIQESTAE